MSKQAPGHCGGCQQPKIDGDCGDQANRPGRTRIWPSELPAKALDFLPEWDVSVIPG